MRKRDDEFFSPDLTPLIDVTFLLLIFFIVSSVFKKQEFALLLNLPPSSTAAVINPNVQDLVLEIKGEKLALAGKEISLEQLAEALPKLVNEKTLVHLRSDRDGRYYQIIEVLDLLKRLNISNLNLVTTKEN